MSSIYIASPLGFSDSGRYWYYNLLIPKIETLGFKINDPWKMIDQEEWNKIQDINMSAVRLAALKLISEKTARLNAKAIRDSDCVLAILDGCDLDSGTCSEVGYAYGIGKRVHGLRTDFRLCADNEASLVNLQVQFFIEDSGGSIFTSVEELMNYGLFKGLLK